MHARRKSGPGRWLKRLGLFLLLVLIGLQFVPYGRDHHNPPVLAEPEWDRPETRATFYRVCGDCHSHQTRWPWYSHVAPASWLIQRDVEDGRAEFNVSFWGRPENAGDEAAEELEEGHMPPWFYLPLHAEARLTEEEKQAFIEGLVATFGTREEGSGSGEEETE